MIIHIEHGSREEVIPVADMPGLRRLCYERCWALTPTHPAAIGVWFVIVSADRHFIGTVSEDDT